MINSRKIEDLDPAVQPICRMHIRSCAAEGIEIITTATFRDWEQQNELYKVGRTPGDLRNKVTDAIGGKSWHQYRCAYDVCPIIGGKCVWDDDHIWSRVIALGVLSGAEAGAQWKTFPDRPHFQVIPKNLTLVDASIRFSAHGSIFI